MSTASTTDLWPTWPVQQSDPVPQLKADVLAAELLPRRWQDADDGEPEPNSSIAAGERVLAAVRGNCEPGAAWEGGQED